jgi:hypothetical protein
MKTETPGHKDWCPVCKHPDKEKIKDLFIRWVAPSRISKLYSIRSSYIRYHADIFGWTKKRQENLKARLERIIEDEVNVPVSASQIVQAVEAYAKLNDKGKMDPQQIHLTNMNELFERMTQDELLQYAESGQLPAWFETVTDK